MISDEVKIQVLVNHYDDTCKDVKEQISLRDRWLFFILGLVALGFFQIADPAQSSQVILTAIDKSIGSKVSVNMGAISAVIWFIFLAVSARYFQTNVYINRRYTYLHELEEKINTLANDQIIIREGKGYLKKYPLFSDWMHVVYTWVFPLALIVAVVCKIAFEWPGWAGVTLSFVLSIVFASMTLISAFLYLWFIHKK